MNKIKIIVLISAFFCISFPQKTSKDIQTDINNRNLELEEIQNDIKKVESAINLKINEEKNNKELINDIDNKITLTEKLIEKLIDEEIYLSKLISKTEARIIIKEKELIELQNQLKNRVRYLYKNGREKVLEELFSLKNSEYKIYRLKYLEILNEYENEIKERINNNIKNLKKEKTNLLKEKDRKNYLLTEKSQKYDNLETDKILKKTYIKKIKEEKKDLQEKLKSQKLSLEKIETIISKLYENKNETKKREKELEIIRAQRNKSTTGNFSKMKGKLLWPAHGKIINKFGVLNNTALNTKLLNPGIDIDTSQKTSVKAVVDGVVTVQTSIDEYNSSSNILIIRHGDGYMTVYKNLENIKVKKGDYLSSGEKIANVAKNTSNNYILHFEVWKDNKNLDPEDWLLNK